MTEDEAKAKACCGPWAVNWSGRSAGSMFGAEPSKRAQTCIASACMAWRWNDHAEDSGTWAAGYRPGHCGLAGSPS